MERMRETEIQDNTVQRCKQWKTLKFSTNKMAGFCSSYCEKPSNYDFCVIFYEC